MILAVDVDYHDARVRIAGILLREWGDALATADRVAECVVTNDYLPDEFFSENILPVLPGMSQILSNTESRHSG